MITSNCVEIYKKRKSVKTLPARFNIDLNLGDGCNFRCTYCFEHEHSAARVLSEDVFVKFIDVVKQMTAVGTEITINLWGGEPLTYPEKIDRLLTEFAENKLVSFLMYTNGWYIEDYSTMLLKHKDVLGKRLVIQVSHDFLPADKSHRVNLSASPEKTIERVLGAIKFLDENDFAYSIKSTGSFEDLEENLCEQYVNFYNFRSTLIHKDRIGFGYTPDSCATRAIDEDKFGKQLVKLLKFFAANKLKETNFKWFFQSTQRLSCGAGKSSFAIDVNGNAKYCHGCFYHNEADDDTLKIANIFDENFLYKVEHNFVAENNLVAPAGRCTTCDVNVCFRCNAINCHGDVANWNEPCVENVCAMFKFLSPYVDAYHTMAKKW